MPPYTKPVSQKQAHLFGAAIASAKVRKRLGISLADLKGKMKGVRVSKLPVRSGRRLNRRVMEKLSG